MPHIVYSPRYDIRACGLERLHPFDSRKYSRAFDRLSQQLGPGLTRHVTRPRRAVDRDTLLTVHSEGYLEKLRKSSYLAGALEVAAVSRIPASFLHHAVLQPMRWGCAGSELAGELAMEHRVAVNLSGGYHHAKPDSGEGFCIYSDIAILIQHVRNTGVVAPGARVAYVDLDAHQGNGVCTCFHDDRDVFIFDMFNHTIYPSHDVAAADRVDCPVPLEPGCDSDTYTALLQQRLPEFLGSVMRKPLDLIVYNAGTDILTGDPLGGLAVSASTVIARDRFVVRQALDRHVPVVMLLSGGYTFESHRVIADSLEAILALDLGLDFSPAT